MNELPAISAFRVEFGLGRFDYSRFGKETENLREYLLQEDVDQIEMPF